MWALAVEAFLLMVAWEMWKSDSKTTRIVAVVIALPTAIALYITIDEQARPLTMPELAAIFGAAGCYLLWEVRSVLREIRGLLLAMKTESEARDHGPANSR